jgi:hypothetical protein
MWAAEACASCGCLEAFGVQHKPWPHPDQVMAKQNEIMADVFTFCVPRSCDKESFLAVAILTGYPCCQSNPPTETDGPLGALAVARILLSVPGTHVTLLTDEVCPPE